MERGDFDHESPPVYFDGDKIINILEFDDRNIRSVSTLDTSQLNNSPVSRIHSDLHESLTAFNNDLERLLATKCRIPESEDSDFRIQANIIEAEHTNYQIIKNFGDRSISMLEIHSDTSENSYNSDSSDKSSYLERTDQTILLYDGPVDKRSRDGDHEDELSAQYDEQEEEPPKKKWYHRLCMCK